MNFWTVFRNTLFVTVCTVIVASAVSFMSAYGISHLPFILDPFITIQSFKGERGWAALAALLIIGVLLIVPFGRMVRKLLDDKKE